MAVVRKLDTFGNRLLYKINPQEIEGACFDNTLKTFIRAISEPETAVGKLYRVKHLSFEMKKDSLKMLIDLVFAEKF